MQISVSDPCNMRCGTWRALVNGSHISLGWRRNYIFTSWFYNTLSKLFISINVLERICQEQTFACNCRSIRNSRAPSCFMSQLAALTQVVHCLYVPIWQHPAATGDNFHQRTKGQVCRSKRIYRANLCWWDHFNHAVITQEGFCTTAFLQFYWQLSMGRSWITGEVLAGSVDSTATNRQYRCSGRRIWWIR